MSGESSRRLKLFGVTAVMIVLALTMTSCFGGPGPREYDLVDAAANQLQIDEVGTVLYEHHYGQMQRMDGAGPTFELFIATDDPNAAQTIVDNAVRIGWDGSGNNLATTTREGNFLAVQIEPWPADKPAQMGDGKTHEWSRAGLLVSIAQS